MGHIQATKGNFGRTEKLASTVVVISKMTRLKKKSSILTGRIGYLQMLLRQVQDGHQLIVAPLVSFTS